MDNQKNECMPTINEINDKNVLNPLQNTSI
jgi:hypothetical protein